MALPETVFMALQGQRQPFWLDSGTGGTHQSRYSFVSANPCATWMVDKKGQGVYRTYSANGDLVSLTEDQDPLSLLSRILEARSASYREALNTQFEAKGEEGPPFLSGAVGYLSYEARHLIEKLPGKAENDMEMPWGRFDFYDWCYVYDHFEGEAFLVSPYKKLKDELLFIQGLIGKAAINGLALEAEIEAIQNKSYALEEPKSDMKKVAYEAAIAAIKGYIASGDIYQMNMTQRFKAPALKDSPEGLHGDDFSLYRKLRRLNPAPFSAFLSYPEFTALCSSPERFVQVRNRLIETRPIKGTVKRSVDPDQDMLNREWLQNSEKDRSELLMIVDLERNDLSKVAAKGSVEVTELFKIETYPTVHHLVSTVQAILKDKYNCVDVIKAVFPGGSITGTPKIRAMEIIDTLEPTARNLYTGAIGYLSDCGGMDLNIVIRTIIRQGDTYHYQVGGGIVWDSNTDSEYEECFIKGKALKEALWSC